PIAILCVLLGLHPRPVLRAIQPEVDMVSRIADKARERAGIPPHKPRTAQRVTEQQGFCSAFRAETSARNAEQKPCRYPGHPAYLAEASDRPAVAVLTWRMRFSLTSASRRLTRSARLIGPRSPSTRSRTATVPADCSLSPTTST